MDFQPLDPGERTASITIQQLSTSPDSFGEAVPNWTTFASGLWAKIETLAGRELYNARLQVQALATHSVKFPWLAGVTPEMQILWLNSAEGTRTLRILHPNDVQGLRQEWWLTCIEEK